MILRYESSRVTYGDSYITLTWGDDIPAIATGLVIAETLGIKVESQAERRDVIRALFNDRDAHPLVKHNTIINGLPVDYSRIYEFIDNNTSGSCSYEVETEFHYSPNRAYVLTISLTQSLG